MGGQFDFGQLAEIKLAEVEQVVCLLCCFFFFFFFSFFFSFSFTFAFSFSSSSFSSYSSFSLCYVSVFCPQKPFPQTRTPSAGPPLRLSPLRWTSPTLDPRTVGTSPPLEPPLRWTPLRWTPPPFALSPLRFTRHEGRGAPPKFHEKTTPREGRKNENEGGRGKKMREILSLPPFRLPTLRAPTLRGPSGAPPFFLVWAPPYVVPKFNIPNWPKSKLAEVFGSSRVHDQ